MLMFVALCHSSNTQQREALPMTIKVKSTLPRNPPLCCEMWKLFSAVRFLIQCELVYF